MAEKKEIDVLQERICKKLALKKSFIEDVVELSRKLEQFSKKMPAETANFLVDAKEFIEESPNCPEDKDL